ncbi:MAG: hypothetical protein ACFFD5_05305 [Candidatus Thorarchaeota archaeon]
MKKENQSNKKAEILSKIQKYAHRILVKFEKREKRIFKITGWIILIACIIYWVFFFFIARQYEPLLYTTYITTILIALTCINEFKSTFLNSITGLTMYGFLNITIAMIPLVTNIVEAFVGPVLHGSIVVFQLYLILHRKIPICRRFLIWGVLFYFIFMSSYDSFHRWDIITGVEHVVPTAFTMAYAFYALLFSAVLIYFYKKRYGIITDN